MPFKSKAQMRKFFWMEAHGKIGPGVPEQWARETDMKKLPKKIKQGGKNGRGKK